MADVGFPFHLTITFSGSAEALPETVPGGGRIRSMMLHVDPANLSVVYIGGKNRALTSSDWGVRLPAPVAGEPCAPFPIGNFQDGSVSIQGHYVLGAVGEKVHLFGHAYL